MEDKLRATFAEALGTTADQITDTTTYSEFPNWDSVAHMALIAAIEESFDIMIDAEDVIDMSNFAKAKQIVAKYL
ncbi:MAG: acyl carrier protein [Roseateles sp.]|uniref:acyl carrier protein n=1 Tax=Roseateles sp. TaxID=1971397 RepID=UPI0039EAC4B1